MGYVLRSARGNKLGLAIPIRKRVFLIGSAPKSQIRSTKEGIGRRHCAIVVRKKKLYVQDLESGFPTHVNGLTITPGSRLPLKQGDRLNMGPMEFVVETKSKKKRDVPVAAPFAAPPVPMGRPVLSKPAATPVPVNDALVFAMPPPASPPSRGNEQFWTLAAFGVLAVVGLLVGGLIARGIVGRNNENQVVEEDRKTDDTPPDRSAPRLEPDRTPTVQKKQETPVVEKKSEPVVEKQPEPKKTEEPKKPEPKKVDEPMKPEVPPMPPPVAMKAAYTQHVVPLLQARCISCHAGPKKKGGLDVSSIDAMLKGGDGGPAIVAGDAEKSPLFQRVDDNTMPPAGKPLTAAEKKILQDWIQSAGAGGFAK